MPPKKFIYHYRSMKGDHPVKIHTDVEYISKYLSQLKQNIKLKNNVISNINLDDLQFSWIIFNNFCNSKLLRYLMSTL